MLPTRLSLAALVSGAVDVGLAACTRIRDVLASGRLEVQQKGPQDPVTRADVECQQLIGAYFRARFPAVRLIGEEDISHYDPMPDAEIRAIGAAAEAQNGAAVAAARAASVPDELRELDPAQLCCWVDPLDGTAEFVKRNTQAVTVLIGFAYRGRPVGGVIAFPFQAPLDAPPPPPPPPPPSSLASLASPPSADELFVPTASRVVFGIVNGGTVFGVKCDPQAQRSLLRDHVVIAVSASHLDDLTLSCAQSVPNCQLLRVGGAGYKSVLLADGEADVYAMLTRGTKRWDTCAPEAVLMAVGGTLVDVFGQPYSYEASIESPVNETGLYASRIGHEHYLTHFRGRLVHRL